MSNRPERLVSAALDRLRQLQMDNLALTAQRDALLDALRECTTHTRRSTLDPTDIVPTAGAMIARAAIKAVEGEKT